MTATIDPREELLVDTSTTNPAADHPANLQKNFASAPMTGDEYIASLQDGREVFIHGERVEDVTTHPAFRNPIRMAARLYDSLHGGPEQETVTCPTDTGNGGVTMPFFRTATTSEDMLKDRDAIASWARMTYGWMGRSPDYKASFLGTLHANSDLYSPFEANAERWYRESQEKVLYWNHAIINPPVDRQLPPDEVGDVFMRVEKETDAGLIVSGAKVVATGSAITNYNFIAHYGLPIKKREFALVCTVPMNAPGVKLICAHVVRAERRHRRHPVRLPAIQPAGRERRDLHLRQGARALGERLHLRRGRPDQRVLPAVRLPASRHASRVAPAWPSSSTSSPGCCSRPWTAPEPATSAVCRPGSER